MRIEIIARSLMRVICGLNQRPQRLFQLLDPPFQLRVPHLVIRDSFHEPGTGQSFYLLHLSYLQNSKLLRLCAIASSR
jgi:hypothetical protein